MKKVLLISALALMSIAAVAQQRDDVQTEVNQYGQKVTATPVDATVQDGILVFQNKAANYKMWFDVRVQADAAVYFGYPNFCADGRNDHIGNGMSLRRTRFAVEATYAGLTDEEILAAAKKGCDCLDVEHLLHAATLTNNVAEKIAIYELAANKYGDARAYNNLGVYKAVSGDLAGAKAAFEKAEAEPAVAGNLAAVALAMGDLETAKKYLAGADAEKVKATEGALALAEGNYQEAKGKLTGYNLAIAELCDNNVEGAKAAIAEVKGADADYVRAIIANREGDADKAQAYLKSAVAAKPELKAQAANDIEFYELLQTNEL